MKSLRRQMESNVLAHHKQMPRTYLAEMDWITLLRWMSPDERAKCTMELVQQNEITKQQAKEFVKIP